MRLMMASFLIAGLAMQALPASAALSGYWESSKALHQIATAEGALRAVELLWRLEGQAGIAQAFEAAAGSAHPVVAEVFRETAERVRGASSRSEYE